MRETHPTELMKMFYLVYSSEYDADDVVAEFESLEAAFAYCAEHGYYSGSDGYCGSYHVEDEAGRVFELPAE
jgi:sugar phosphate isomerase/epimerase